MRNISFSLTTPQFKARSKDVTRRLGWVAVRADDHLMGCEKCMGRKAGEPLVRLGEIVVVSARREQIGAMLHDLAYGADECRREGFPDMTPQEFVRFWLASHHRDLDGRPTDLRTMTTRIEFRYL